MIQKNGKLYDPKKKMENYMFFQLKVRLNIHIIQNRKITAA